jgi:hypothetical protein
MINGFVEKPGETLTSYFFSIMEDHVFSATSSLPQVNQILAYI